MAEPDRPAAAPSPPTEAERARHAIVLGVVLGTALVIVSRARRAG